jgi:hypothetical protein
MSDALSADMLADIAQSDRGAYFEQRLFVLSPLGDLATAALFFLVPLAIFVSIVWSENAGMIAAAVNGGNVAQPLRTAFALSATLATALYIQRYTRIRERADYHAFEQSFTPAAMTRHEIAHFTPRDARLHLATLVGLVGGALVSIPLYMKYLSTPAMFGWFLAMTTLLAAAFTRGVELSRAATGRANKAIAQDLKVDLLHIDRLSVWGRSAARFALLWFAVGAAACLFFLDSGINPFTVSLVLLFLAMGVWVFLRTMQPVHRRIRATKNAELERVRSDLVRIVPAVRVDAAASVQMQGLLAYEARIQGVAEWPFDQTTLYRVCASALILTVPWFGQAIAGFLIEHLAR